MNQNAKARIVKVHPYSLALMFHKGNKIEVLKGIPEGATLIGAGYDANSNCFYLQITHDDFDPIKPGQNLPPHELEIGDLREDKQSDGNTD